jgi:hypothetical protein
LKARLFKSLEQIKAGLHSADPSMAGDAARALAEPHEFELPPLAEVYELLLQAEKTNPGVADAFWVQSYDCRIAGDDLTINWMIEVIGRRGERARLAVEFSGNDLEFHLHEAVDDRPQDLLRLIDLGCKDIIESAMDHNALKPPDLVRVCEHMITNSRPEFRRMGVSYLALYGKIAHPEGVREGWVKQLGLQDTDVIQLRLTPQTQCLLSKLRIEPTQWWTIFEKVIPMPNRGQIVSRSEWETDPRFKDFAKRTSETRCFTSGLVAWMWDFNNETRLYFQQR